jgi:hypothetical protein
MNTNQVQIEPTETANIVLVDNTYFENEAIEKFNFAKTKQDNKKQFFLFLIPIVIIITSFIGFSVYSNGIVESPEILVPTAKISNEPVVIVSKSKPFFVKLNNEVIHSQLKDKNWTVDLGKIQGTTNVQVGGMIDFGFTKLVSNTTKSYTFERDYIAPKTTTDLKSKYEVRDVKYSITLEAPEDNYIVRDNQAIIYDKNLPNNNCKIEKENPLKLNCSMTLEPGKADVHQVIITDQYGNSSTIGDGIIQVVDVNNFDCNKDVIADEGKIKCKGNKDSRVTIAGITQDYKASTDFEAQTVLDNGSKQFDIKIVDKDDITKSLNYDVVVDKDKLRVDLSSTKFKDNCNFFYCEGKVVKAIANKPVTVNLSYTTKIVNVKTGQTKLEPAHAMDTLTSRINANVDTNFFKHTMGYVDGPGPSNQYSIESTYNLSFTADNGKSVNYTCNEAFMCNER